VGIPLVVEVNANPYLERTSAFALAALQAGMGYATMINRIVEIARKRWEPTPFLIELQKNRATRAKLRRQLEKAIESCETLPLKENVKENVESQSGQAN
jgi:hypothetical protein